MGIILTITLPIIGALFLILIFKIFDNIKK